VKIKLLVTHKAPDLDAITSVWLFLRFLPQQTNHAKVLFVNPGETLSHRIAEEHQALPHEVIHVDTGLGEFDHHQPERATQYLSASKIIFQSLSKKISSISQDQALSELIDYVTDIDQYSQINWPESSTIHPFFRLEELIANFHGQEMMTDEKVMDLGCLLLDSAYLGIKRFLTAKAELQNATELQLKNGKCVAIVSGNDYVLDVAQLSGAIMTLRKDDKTGGVRIKCRPDSNLNLHDLYERIIIEDKVGHWYFHPGGKMLLNGSNKRPDQIPTPLSLENILTFIKEIYG
jgi:hypothetical protein